MTKWQILVSAWDWEPSVVIGCAALMVAYAEAVGWRFSRKAVWFTLGMLVLFLSLVSPIDRLADTYLFSAHMLQHMLMILVAPPLLLLGIPARLASRVVGSPGMAKVERVLSRPVLAWSIGIGDLWIWHWPRLYNLALAHEGLHIFEHLTFLVAFTIFWWPILAPVEELRLPPLQGVVYVFSACSAHTILAIILTFAPLGYFPAYIHPVDSLGILPLLRNDWGISPQVDQQLGGLLMWVPSCVVFLGFMMGLFARWYREPETGNAAYDSSPGELSPRLHREGRADDSRAVS